MCLINYLKFINILIFKHIYWGVLCGETELALPKNMLLLTTLSAIFGTNFKYKFPFVDFTPSFLYL